MRKLFAFRTFKTLFRNGRLALRLARDQRVPLYAKAALALTLLYVFTPIDIVPDWLPVVGQLDDLALLAGGLALFIRLCPPPVVAEHEAALGYRPRSSDGDHGAPERPAN